MGVGGVGVEEAVQGEDGDDAVGEVGGKVRLVNPPQAVVVDVGRIMPIPADTVRSVPLRVSQGGVRLTGDATVNSSPGPGSTTGTGSTSYGSW